MWHTPVSAGWFLGFLNSSWDVFVLSAPWLIIGFVLAGVIHVILPEGLIYKHLSSTGFRSILKATVIGIPLPLCSCGVIPLAMSLRKQGASKGATSAFLVSTPEIGIDSFALSYALLGPVVTLWRLFTAALTALGVGLLVDRFAESAPPNTTSSTNNSNCCSSKSSLTVDRPTLSLTAKIRESIRYGFGTLLDDLAPLLIWGILLAGLISALAPDELFSTLNLNRFLSMLIMMLVALPMYVCSVASTPLAAVLLQKGLDPGAVIVFLLAGPATNITTMLSIRSNLGNRTLLVYLVGIAVCSFCAGTLISYQNLSFLLPHEHPEGHAHGSSITNGHFYSAILLLALVIQSLARKYGFLGNRNSLGKGSGSKIKEETEKGSKQSKNCCCKH